MQAKRSREDKRNSLKRIILREAKEIAASEGWQNVTIRKICDKIHYTAPVIYQHFENKEMILCAIRIEAMTSMYEIFEEIDKKYEKPDKRLLKYGLAWWHFAHTNPELYQVMYNLQGALCVDIGTDKPTYNTVIDFYKSAFSELNRDAKYSEKLMIEFCDNIIAIIHGFISLHMVGKIRSGKEDAEDTFKNALKRFIHSIQDK